MYKTIAEINAKNKEAGFCWFEKEAMAFFSSKIESDVMYGHFFITSEKCGEGHPRLFSVRYADIDGDIRTMGKFQGHKTKAAAKAFIETIAFKSGEDRYSHLPKL